MEIISNETLFQPIKGENSSYCGTADGFPIIDELVYISWKSLDPQIDGHDYFSLWLLIWLLVQCLNSDVRLFSSVPSSSKLGNYVSFCNYLGIYISLWFSSTKSTFCKFIFPFIHLRNGKLKVLVSVMVKPKLMNLYEVGGNPEASPPPLETIWLVITKIPRLQMYSRTFSNTKPSDIPIK